MLRSLHLVLWNILDMAGFATTALPIRTDKKFQYVVYSWNAWPNAIVVEEHNVDEIHCVIQGGIQAILNAADAGISFR